MSQGLIYKADDDGVNDDDNDVGNAMHSFIHLFTGAYSPGWTFSLPFRGFLITHRIRHTVGLFWTSDQPVAEASTYTGQHNI
jgi:hypothetical protein